MGIASHAVLGTEQGDKLDARCLVEDVNGTLEVVINAAGIGHQPHALALQLSKATVTQHLDTRLDNSTCSHRRQHAHY